MSNAITFSLGGGVGTPIPGSDYISGVQFYNASAPSGLTLNVAKALFSVADAENAGILADYNDETPATGTITLTYGATGDTVKIVVTEPNINGTVNVVNLGTYTVLSTDTTSVILTTSVNAFINLGTPTHGYSATHTTTVITLHARTGLGTALNSGTPLAVTETGTTTSSITQFASGVQSKQAIWHYQISEYFRIQPSGKCWIQFSAVPSTYNFDEVYSMQVQAGGEIRQFGVFSPNSTTPTTIAADIDALNAQGVLMYNANMPASFILAGNIFAVSDLSTLTNLRLRQANYVSFVIAQSGSGLGAWLSLTAGTSVCSWGAALGTTSLSAVQQSIGYVAQFNVSNGTEDEVIAFGNGQLSTAVSANLQSQLDSYGYVYLISYPGRSGSYWNGGNVACPVTSIYSYLERNRTIGKAQRIIYTVFTPLIQSGLYSNADGTVTNTTINVFKNALNPSLTQMVANGEISAYSISIDPRQNTLATSTIAVVVNILGVGVARHIVVQLNYVAKL